MDKQTEAIILTTKYIKGLIITVSVEAAAIVILIAMLAFGAYILKNTVEIVKKQGVLINDVIKREHKFPNRHNGHPKRLKKYDKYSKQEV